MARSHKVHTFFECGTSSMVQPPLALFLVGPPVLLKAASQLQLLFEI